MPDTYSFKYIIVGGGLAGAFAVEGIRSVDRGGSIALFCKEARLPYDRPPLSKDLWVGKKKLDQISPFGGDYYEKEKVRVHLNREVVSLDCAARTVQDQAGNTFRYEKLLLATGGSPRALPNDQGLVHYFRTVEDYLDLREAVGRLR